MIKPEDIDRLKKGDLSLYTRLLKEGGKDHHKRKNRMLTVKPGSSTRLPPVDQADDDDQHQARD